MLKTISTFAQDTEFKFAKEGLTDFIATTYNSAAKDTYNRAVTWGKDNAKKNVVVVFSVEN